MTALNLAARIAAGELSAGEALEEAISRTEAVDARLNAVTRTLYDEARAEVAAGLPEGPFTGVPFPLKDLSISYAGVPTTGGSRAMMDMPAQRDSELMRRYRAAGMVAYCKTNTPELGSLGTTEPLLFGPCRNPWNPEHSCGGSSGGSAVLVAARAVPIAHATDGAGSIRIPASCCGIFGLKPTRARITMGPDVGEAVGGIANEHAVSISVQDNAALLDATQGGMPGDPYACPPPERPFAKDVGADPGRLRIAFTDRSITGTSLHPDCVAAVQDTAKLLEDLGYDVEEAAPPLDVETFREFYIRFWPFSVARHERRLSRAAGRPVDRSLFEPFNRYLLEKTDSILAADYLADLAWFHGMSRDFAAFMEGYALWLTPTLGHPPPRLGHFDCDAYGGPEVMERFMQFLPFTPFANLTGQPSATLPLHWNAEGLPVGSLLTARYGDEAMLFRVSAQLEEARPWAGRIPPGYGGEEGGGD